MRSHFLLLVLFAALVSVVFAVLTKEEPAEQIRYGALLFAGFLGAALVLGWILYPFPL